MKSTLLNADNNNKKRSIEYKVYCYRYIIGITYCCFVFIKSISMSAFGSIADIMIKAYDINTVIFQSESYVILFSYVVGNFPSNYVIQKFGTKFPISLAMFLIVIGSWIKILINYWFYFTILGMLFVGVGQFLLLNSIVNLSNDWFSPKERVI